MASADRASHDCAVTQCSGHNIRSFTGGGEAACDGELAVILNDCRTFFAIVLLQLLITLDDTHDAELSGSGCAEHHFNGLYRWQSSKLIQVPYYSLFQSTTIAVCHTQDFTVELLEKQGYHEVGIRVFFRENHIVGTLHLTEPFSIHNGIKAEDLLQLRIQEAVEPGHRSRHDRLHCLF